MEAQTVFTPKAVMLMARIKRNLASKGVAGQVDAWGYEAMISLCDGMQDPELEGWLTELREEMAHKTAPGTWAI